MAEPLADPATPAATDELAAPFWAACARGELVIQTCRDCGHRMHPPRPACTRCGGLHLAFDPVSGRGSVEAVSVVHRTFAPGFADRVPYVIAWVALPEQPGLRVFSTIVDVDHEVLDVGLDVVVGFDHVNGVGPLPVFRPAGSPVQRVHEPGGDDGD